MYLDKIFSILSDFKEFCWRQINKNTLLEYLWKLSISINKKTINNSIFIYLTKINI